MNETGEARQLGFWICLALVVGNMIGSGIFLLPANLAPFGANAIWGWALTIGGALCLATVFSALAKAMPDAGGPYDYVARSLGSPPAFLVMWSYWISTWVTNSAIAIAAPPDVAFAAGAISLNRLVSRLHPLIAASAIPIAK